MIMSVWLAALGIYVVFLAWYYNWSGPLKEHEIELLLQKYVGSPGARTTDIDVVKEFLRRDDGKEFFMQNFIRLKKGQIPHPVTGEETSASELLARYSATFGKAIFKRAGHPVFMALKVGGFIDSWETNPDEKWHITSMMRYRSRREVFEVGCDPVFDDIHIFKTAAIEKTASFPVQIKQAMIMRPGVYVPLLLVLLATIAQLFLSQM